ncbi:MAG: hypothetical protein BGO68_03415 [Candidatus Amoebophilus sp. 36-38]|nr:MAG: hypothetical protein BGO68_03415 [Candidatus Amoebophilus sp. 36-38]
MRKNNKKQFAHLAVPQSHLLSLLIIFSMSGCSSCNLGAKDPKGNPFDQNSHRQEANISLKPQPFVKLEELRGKLDSDNSVTISLVLKNEDAFASLTREELENVTLKITNQENIDKIMYVTAARTNPADKRWLIPTKFSEITNNAINLWEFLKVLDLIALGGWEDKKVILSLFPKDLGKPASCNIELEGSVSRQNSVKVVWKPLVSLDLEIEGSTKSNAWNLAEPLDQDGDFLIDIIIENKEELNSLTPNVLQTCKFKVIDAENIDQITCATGIKDDKTFRVSTLPFNSPINLWSMLQFLNPQGIAGGGQGGIKTWVRPLNSTEEARFTMEILDDNDNVVNRETIVWNP